VHQLIDRVSGNEDGAAIVEYALLVGFLAVVCFGAITPFGTQLSTIFSATAAALAAI
jgi:Flp pilus assembly pilin Flp